MVSSVNVNEAGEGFPGAPVSLATIVCCPSASPVGVKVHAPPLLAVTVVEIGLPSTVKETTAFAMPVPTSLGLLVTWSLDDAPVSLSRRSVTFAVGVWIATCATDVCHQPLATYSFDNQKEFGSLGSAVAEELVPQRWTFPPSPLAR